MEALCGGHTAGPLLAQSISTLDLTQLVEVHDRLYFYAPQITIICPGSMKWGSRCLPSGCESAECVRSHVYVCVCTRMKDGEERLRHVTSSMMAQRGSDLFENRQTSFLSQTKTNLVQLETELKTVADWNLTPD